MKRIEYSLFLIISCCLLTVHASGAAVCSISSTGTAFGVFDTLSGNNDDMIGTITVTCTGNIGDSGTYSIALSPGGGGFGPRTMQTGGHSLSYNLYSDAAHNSVWGDGSAGTSTVGDTYLLSATTYTKDYTVYGRILGPQHNAVVGSYLDNVVITLTYF
jgi:spore coat protein U-like protein